MKKSVWLWLPLLCIVLFLSGCGEKNVAVVNGEGIPYEDFTYYWDNLSKIYEANKEDLSDDLKETVVEQLVYDKLLEQTAKELGCTITEEEAEADYQEQMAEVYGSYETAKDEIKIYGVDEDFFRSQYLSRLRGEKIVDAVAAEQNEDLGSSLEEAQELYDADPAAYDFRDVSHLLVKPYAADEREVSVDEEGNEIYTKAEWQGALQRAEQLIAKISEEEPFAALATKYSDDETTVASGGRIPEKIFADSSDYDKALIDAAFSLKKAGEYTEKPIKTQNGYEIVYCNEALSPDDMDAVLAYIMTEQEKLHRKELLNDYMQKQESAAEIEYNKENIK